MNNYESILSYFEHIATTSAHFQHGTSGKVAFIGSDMGDFKALESVRKLSFPLMIAGFNGSGIDNARGRFTINDSDKNFRSYDIPVAILKEVSQIDTHGESTSTLISLDEIADDILSTIVEDRAKALRRESGAVDICFLKHMTTDIPIAKTAVIGGRKALGIILYFNFNFTR